LQPIVSQRVTSDGFDSVPANEADPGAKPSFRACGAASRALEESQGMPQRKVKPEGNRPGQRSRPFFERRSEHGLETPNRVRLGGRRGVYPGVKKGQRLTVFIKSW
jgi:hypothetical protein